MKVSSRRLWSGLMNTDLKKILRDPLLFMIPLGIVLAAGAFSLGIPILQRALLPFLDLREWYALLASFLYLMAPLMIGFLSGFLLLEDRDSGGLLALQVTPFGKEGYLAYRLSASAVFSFPALILVYLVLSFSRIPPGFFIPFALAAVLGAPFSTLFICSFAKNKVQGLAVAKSLGILLLSPLSLVFIPQPFVYCFGIFPPFWIAKIYQDGVNRQFALFFIDLAAGLAVHLIYILILGKVFNRRTEESV